MSPLNVGEDRNRIQSSNYSEVHVLIDDNENSHLDSPDGPTSSLGTFFSPLEREGYTFGSNQHELEPNLEFYENFTTIDWMKDKMQDYKLRDLRKSKFTQMTPGKAHLFEYYDTIEGWIIFTAIGITVGLIAAWIDVASAWLTDIKLGFCMPEWYLSKRICCKPYENTESCPDWHDWSFAMFSVSNVHIVQWLFYVFLSASFAVSCAFLIVKLAPYAAGSGTAEIKTILGGFIIRNFLGLKTLLMKMIGLPLTVASGLAVGKEGPMIHVSCCVGNIFPAFFSKYWKNEARKREVLSAASAAGVAVAFGAPIGGVLFSLEELSTFFPPKTMVRSFFCALVGTVTLQILDPYRGKKVLYDVTYSREWHLFELLFFVFLGIFGGISGALVIRLSVWVQALRKKFWLSKKPILEVFIISSLTAMFFYFSKFTRIDSSELLEYLFKECPEMNFNEMCNPDKMFGVVTELIFSLCLRLIFTVISLGLKVPAGIFIPSMVWGAMYGRMLGILAASIQRSNPTFFLFSSCHPDKECVTPGMYALLGAMASLCGVTRLSLSLTVIMFELTGTLNYIVPCMITIMIAKIVGDMFGHDGYAEALIQVNRYPYLDPRGDEVLGVEAKEVMTSFNNLVCCYASGMKAKDVANAKNRNLIQEETQITFEDQVDSHSPALGTINFAAYLDKAPLSVNASMPVEKVLDIFKKIGPRYVIVKENGKIDGMITKKDLLVALNHDTNDTDYNETLSQMSFMTAISSNVSSPQRRRRIQSYVLSPLRSRESSADVLEESHTGNTGRGTVSNALASRFRMNRWNRTLQDDTAPINGDSIELDTFIGGPS